MLQFVANHRWDENPLEKCGKQFNMAPYPQQQPALQTDAPQPFALLLKILRRVFLKNIMSLQKTIEGATSGKTQQAPHFRLPNVPTFELLKRQSFQRTTR
jgi:hypothetical protein